MNKLLTTIILLCFSVAANAQEQNTVSKISTIIYSSLIPKIFLSKILPIQAPSGAVTTRKATPTRARSLLGNNRNAMTGEENPTAVNIADFFKSRNRI